jgi:hypothetical protein
MTDKHSSVSRQGSGYIHPLQSSSRPRRLPLPSPKEANFYYAGLPSRPILVARTGTRWKAPTGPEAYPKYKDLRVVGNHVLKEIWEDNLSRKLHALLDSMEVKWTSTDVVRIGIVGESSAPVILWIGVVPASLSGHDGALVAFKSRELLVEYNIADVDVEIRESIATRTAGPKLLTPVYSSDRSAGIREPITTTLGLPICAQSTPWAGGTAGFFITEGGDSKRLFLVTARHVVFTSLDENKNNHFEHKDDSQCRHNVMLFSDASFNEYLESIQAQIGEKERSVDYNERRITWAEGNDDPAVNELLHQAQVELNESREAVEQLNTFYQDVSKRWATPESRILGHVILSPPINVGVGDECYSEDWAIIEVDASKVDVGNFSGNAIDLGTCISVPEFIRMMCLNPNDADSFMYPCNRILTLEGIIPDEDLRHPTALDENINPCLMVIKRGKTTGLTIGRANDVFSYARFEEQTSKEWAILPFNSKSGSFSKGGDSGSVIVDGIGRIGGLLTGGAGAAPFSDISYATPIGFLLKCMHDKGLRNPNIYPVLT